MSDLIQHTGPTPEMSAACARVRARLLDSWSAREETNEMRLDPRLARDLGHLEACASCARERADWHAFLTALGRAEAPSTAQLAFANEGLLRRLLAQPRSAPLAPRGALAWKARLTPLAIAAGALVALGAMLTTGGGSDRLRSALEPGRLASAGRMATDPAHFAGNFLGAWKRSWNAWTDAN